jgi:hypothetical protein
MSDAVLFVFGLLATIFTLGPLTISAVLELRDKANQK